MAGTTTNFSWPFPTAPDVANVAPDMQSLAAAIDSTLGNAWTAYTPAWTAATVNPGLGNGTIVGRFKRLGKWGMFRITLVYGGTSSPGTGAYRFSLPVGWQLFDLTSLDGTGSFYDLSATTAFNATLWGIAAGPPSTVEMRTHGATAAASGTVPVAIGTGDILQLQGTVELA